MALLAGPLAAQTTLPVPASATPAPVAKAEKSPWLIFDQPLDSLPPARSKAARERPVREKTVRTAQLQPARATAAAPAEEADSGFVPTQGTTYVPLDPDIYRLIDRYAIKYRARPIQRPAHQRAALHPRRSGPAGRANAER